jgi:hypothetical protein
MARAASTARPSVLAAAALAMLLVAGAVSAARAATTVYASESSFFAAMTLHITEDYESGEYAHPDGARGTLTNSHMNEVFGQVTYTPTGFPGRNLVEHEEGRAFYCAGCNGSFALVFTGTALSDGTGVHAVGLRVVSNLPDYRYAAFVRYGDDTTETFELPARNSISAPGAEPFWGITSPKRIRSIHFGGVDGGPVRYGAFAIDNLTIGNIVLSDSDSDGIPDEDDDCIDAPNGPLLPDAGGQAQLDSDNDGYGNICDADLDNDGHVDTIDYLYFRLLFLTQAPVADFNGSGGLVNISDYAIFRTLFGNAPGPSGTVGQ